LALSAAYVCNQHFYEACGVVITQAAHATPETVLLTGASVLQDANGLLFSCCHLTGLCAAPIDQLPLERGS
jgi:hypothetical protein